MRYIFLSVLLCVISPSLTTSALAEIGQWKMTKGSGTVRTIAEEFEAKLIPTAEFAECGGYVERKRYTEELYRDICRKRMRYSYEQYN